MNQECEVCTFEIEKLDNEFKPDELKVDKTQIDEMKVIDFKNEQDSNIDKSGTIEAVLGMPLIGNNEGLIPAFNVYLANTPQDFYNLISIRFIQEMEKVGMKDLAVNLLVEYAEFCAINTFGGIWASDEWNALIKSMVKKEEDNVFGLVAVANALGWGRINVTKHIPYESLSLSSSNGYEAHGFLTMVGPSENSECYMLRGVTAGLMGLVYAKGDYNSRVGLYNNSESACLCSGSEKCQVEASKK